jgi:hypothetical protein
MEEEKGSLLIILSPASGGPDFAFCFADPVAWRCGGPNRPQRNPETGSLIIIPQLGLKRQNE